MILWFIVKQLKPLFVVVIALLAAGCRDSGCRSALKSNTVDFSSLIMAENGQYLSEECNIIDSLPALVVYMDSLTCFSCSIRHLPKSNGRTMLKKSVLIPPRILVIMSPSNQEEWSALSATRYNRSVLFLIDRNNVFLKNNASIPLGRRLHSFVVDSTGHISSIVN